MRIDEVVRPSTSSLRLDELSQKDASRIIENHFESWQQFKEYFYKNFTHKKVGAGQYSVVYLVKSKGMFSFMRGFPKEFVLKVSRPDLTDKDSWGRFVPIANKKFAKNKLFPMIFAHLELENADGGQPVDVSMIEYLTVDPKSDRSKEIQRACGAVVEMFDTYGTDGPDPDEDEEDFEDFESYLDDLDDLGIDQNSFKDMYNTLYKGRRFEYDIHTGNVGYRADGSVCIFDPVV